MLRALLAERFKLVVHNETKDAPIYALILARSDGKLGPQLKKSEIDCAAHVRGRPRARARRDAAARTAAARRDACRAACGSAPATWRWADRRCRSSRTASAMFAGRIVLDRTGLTGNYDIDLTWTPDQMPRPAGAGDRPPQINGVAVDPNGPSLFTAVQEQLGLKLDSQRGPVEMLVIDRAEKPVEE